MVRMAFSPPSRKLLSRLSFAKTVMPFSSWKKHSSVRSTPPRSLSFSSGKPVSEARQLTNKAVAEALDGLPDYKMHCSVLAQEAIESALKDYESRQEKK